MQNINNVLNYVGCLKNEKQSRLVLVKSMDERRAINSKSKCNQIQ